MRRLGSVIYLVIPVSSNIDGCFLGVFEERPCFAYAFLLFCFSASRSSNWLGTVPIQILAQYCLVRIFFAIDDIESSPYARRLICNWCGGSSTIGI